MHWGRGFVGAHLVGHNFLEFESYNNKLSSLNPVLKTFYFAYLSLSVTFIRNKHSVCMRYAFHFFFFLDTFAFQYKSVIFLLNCIY